MYVSITHVLRYLKKLTWATDKQLQVTSNIKSSYTWYNAKKLTKYTQGFATHSPVGIRENIP